jgi:probable O-glycosylation ligase (exosortase A-associated)
MRDILVTLIVFGSLPFIFKKPWFGMVMWIWISVMNPHSQGWGFARTYPFAAVIAGATLLSIVVTKEKKRLPMTPVTVVFILFALWMSVTSLFAIHPDQIADSWIRTYKIFGMTLVVIMLLENRKHIEWMIWTVVVSIGYYGVKGGLFTIRTGGSERVWGPAGTFIDGNNEVALAFVIVIPLMMFLRSMTTSKWGRRALVAAMILCALATLGSYSRGAALAIGAMVLFLWLKSSEKLTLGILIAIAVPTLLLFMPSQWHDRIDTINTYEQDSSAMGRINAWHMAFNLAKDRPLVGGGFQIYDPFVFARYAPVPDDVHAAHSIYFQTLGEHGFVGLFLYLVLGLLTWRTGSWVVRRTRAHASLKWAYDLATMIQVSLLGFAVGGAFLSLVYFDVPYYLMAGLVALRLIVERELKGIQQEAARPAQPSAAAPLPVAASVPQRPLNDNIR